MGIIPSQSIGQSSSRSSLELGQINEYVIEFPGPEIPRTHTLSITVKRKLASCTVQSVQKTKFGVVVIVNSLPSLPHHARTRSAI